MNDSKPVLFVELYDGGITLRDEIAVINTYKVHDLNLKEYPNQVPMVNCDLIAELYKLQSSYQIKFVLRDKK